MMHRADFSPWAGTSSVELGATARASARTYESIPLGRDVVRTDSQYSTEITFLSGSERSQCELQVRDGLFYWPDGSLVDSAEGFSHWNGPGWGIFTMAEGGRIYFRNTQRVGTFHHHSFTNGPAEAAGEAVFEKGRLVRFSNQSGHYTPNGFYMQQFVREVEARGVDTSKVIYHSNSWYPVPVANLMEQKAQPIFRPRS